MCTDWVNLRARVCDENRERLTLTTPAKSPSVPPGTSTLYVVVHVKCTMYTCVYMAECTLYSANVYTASDCAVLCVYIFVRICVFGDSDYYELPCIIFSITETL